MPVLLFVMVALSLGIVVAWVAGEVTGRPLLRRVSAACFLVIPVLAGIGAASVNLFSYNAWYGAATAELIDESIIHLEAGRTAEVTASWKALRADLFPTYEHRARYDQLVKAAVAAMKSTPARKP